MFTSISISIAIAIYLSWGGEQRERLGNLDISTLQSIQMKGLHPI